MGEVIRQEEHEVCEDVASHEACKYVPRQECEDVSSTVCKDVAQETCGTVPVEYCGDVPRKECADVPREVCDDRPFETCHDETKAVNSYRKEKECKTVHMKTCTSSSAKGYSHH